MFVEKAVDKKINVIIFSSFKCLPIQHMIHIYSYKSVLTILKLFDENLNFTDSEDTP